MQLNTKHFGIIEIDEKDILDFPGGIPGFEKVEKFVLLGKIEEESPFQWLQGVDNPDLAFVVIDPKILMPDYSIEVYDKDVEVLEITDEEKVLIYCIVVVPEDVTKMTANLKAPIIINVENNRGKQIVLEKGDYRIKHYIMEELRKIGG